MFNIHLEKHHPTSSLSQSFYLSYIPSLDYVLLYYITSNTIYTLVICLVFRSYDCLCLIISIYLAISTILYIHIYILIYIHSFIFHDNHRNTSLFTC